ncbi:hypothetical protein K439DRAFT_1640043 [Ramaria rubella]|nr:hypothetical protein K439DRAFT_1640043 [Ramaria rubella]
MAWESSIDSPRFVMFKPERPTIDIPRTSTLHVRVDPLRTPEDAPVRHSQLPWYATHIGEMCRFTPYSDDEQPLGHTPFPDVEDGGEMGMVSPPSPCRRTMEMLPNLYNEETPSPPSPSRRTIEMLPDMYENVDMEVEIPLLPSSPSSPSRRSLTDLPHSNEDILLRKSQRDGLRIIDDSYQVYGTVCMDVDDGYAVPPPSPSRRALSLFAESISTGVNGREHMYPEYSNNNMDDQPELSPPSPSRRSLSLLPETDWQPGVDDCPQLSPPSPIHNSTSLPPIDCEFGTHPLFVEDLLPYAHPPTPHGLSHLALRLHCEHITLLSLRDRTIHAERTSRARNVDLRGRERELGRAVAALRDEHPPSSLATLALLPPDSPSQSDALHTYRTLATRVMLERTEEKRRRKKDKERIKELRVILGPGVSALLADVDDDILTGATTDLGNRHSALGIELPDVGLGLGLKLDPESPVSSSFAAELAERSRAMHRLVARMTMRRRDLGMRSLIEAGNMSADGGEGGESVQRQRGGSPLAREVVSAEDLEVEDEDGEARDDFMEGAESLKADSEGTDMDLDAIKSVVTDTMAEEKEGRDGGETYGFPTV